MSGIRSKRNTYEQALLTSGHQRDNGDIPVARLMAIAETEEQAKQVAIKGAEWTTSSYAKGIPSHQEEPDPIDRYVNDVILWGCPERVADTLLRYAEAYGRYYLLCEPRSNKSFPLVNEKVLPRLP